MTVALVLVSHLHDIADGAARLATQMAPDVSVVAAGGTDEGEIGTSFDKVLAALTQSQGADGIVVLYDLGSALLTAETAVEMLEDGRIRIVDAPLVEGAVAGATAAQQGADLATVVQAAHGPRAPDAADRQEPAEPGADALVAEVRLPNPLGLHARPAADLAVLLTDRDADVLVSGTDTGWVAARSVVAVIALGLRGGDVVRLAAEGTDAADVLAAATALVESGFGEGDGADRPPAPSGMSGVAASPGVAEGRALVIVVPTGSEAERTGAHGSGEQRLTAAIETAGAALEEADEPFRPVARAHRSLLVDPMLRGRAMTLVGQGSPEGRAWSTAVAEAYDLLSAVSDPAMADRAADVLDVGARVAAALSGRDYDSGLPDPDSLAGAVLVADELLPSQVVRAHALGACGLVAARGGATAHSAQLARSLVLPAVLGAGERVRAIRDGQRLRVDGAGGAVTVLPDPGPVGSA